MVMFFIKLIRMQMEHFQSQNDKKSKFSKIRFKKKIYYLFYIDRESCHKSKYSGNKYQNLVISEIEFE